MAALGDSNASMKAPSHRLQGCRLPASVPWMPVIRQNLSPNRYMVFMTDFSSEAGSFASVIIRPSTM
jgi:hypothetical protein